ncbi:transposase [Legionella cherrii]|uniref:Transposase n=1 Tax=Legionella cherrii TaxID=28084 RepID=A0ABY6T8T9_9GAMM|nr:transposase [Legionella cherrii]VEB38624.1 transposase [Legionella cherrii]
MPLGKKHPKEFKLDVIRLLLDQGYGVTKAANTLGIAQALLSRWIKEHQEQDSQAFRGNGEINCRAIRNTPAARRK